MHFSPVSVLALAVLSLAVVAPAQDESVRIDTPHPRIFLNARRLKLLRRERDRQSLRWNQFNLLMAGKAPMPERKVITGDCAKTAFESWHACSR